MQTTMLEAPTAVTPLATATLTTAENNLSTLTETTSETTMLEAPAMVTTLATATTSAQ